MTRPALIAAAPCLLALGFAALPLAGRAAPAPAAAPAVAAPQIAPPAASDFEPIPAENLMVIDTTKGRIVVEFAVGLSAEHIERIKVLTRRGFYDGNKFFRVIADFMDQTGDPQNTGQGGSDLPNLTGAFTVKAAPGDAYTPLGKLPTGQSYGFIGPTPAISQSTDLAPLMVDGKINAWGLFCVGVAGMARAQDPNSGNSQFYLMRETNHNLDTRYTPWGRIVQGLDVARAINPGEPPTDPDLMTKVRIASDMPAAEQPKLSRVKASSAYAKAMAAQVQAAQGADFNPCALELPVKAG